MAKREGASSSNQESFFSWLSKNLSESQYSSMSAAISDLNRYFSGKHIVSETFFELEDKKDVARARARLESDRLFRFMNRGKMERMIQLLKQYSLFLLAKELESNQSTVDSTNEPEQKVLDNAPVLSEANNHISCNQTVEESRNEVITQVEMEEPATSPDVANSMNQVNDTIATTGLEVDQHENEVAEEEPHIINSPEPVGQDAAIEYLTSHDIPYADKRAQGGSLWILSDKTIYEQIQELRDLGYVFCYSPMGGKTSGMKPAWYLTSTAKQTEQVHSEHVANQADVKAPLLNEKTKKTSERKQKFELWLPSILECSGKTSGRIA